MDPAASCDEAIRELHAGRGERYASCDTRQVLVALSYLVDQPFDGEDFLLTLQLIAASADRAGQASLAAVARAVLHDWLAQARGPAGAATHPASPPPA